MMLVRGLLNPWKRRGEWTVVIARVHGALDQSGQELLWLYPSMIDSPNGMQS